jgi:hypothetical protein
LGLYCAGRLDRQAYKAAAEAATYGLYERVKGGEVLLKDLLSAGGGGGEDGGLAAAEIGHVVDLMLAEAGVEVD